MSRQKSLIYRMNTIFKISISRWGFEARKATKFRHVYDDVIWKKCVLLQN